MEGFLFLKLVDWSVGAALYFNTLFNISGAFRAHGPAGIPFLQSTAPAGPLCLQRATSACNLSRAADATSIVTYCSRTRRINSTYTRREFTGVLIKTIPGSTEYGQARTGIRISRAYVTPRPFLPSGVLLPALRTILCHSLSVDLSPICTFLMPGARSFRIILLFRSLLIYPAVLHFRECDRRSGIQVRSIVVSASADFFRISISQNGTNAYVYRMAS